MDEVGGRACTSGRLSLFCAVSRRLFMFVVMIVSGFLKVLFPLVARGIGEVSGNISGMMNFWGASSLVEVDFGDGICSGILKPFRISFLVFFGVFLERFDARCARGERPDCNGTLVASFFSSRSSISFTSQG